MTSIIHSWQERIKEKYGTQIKAVDKLNMICGLKLRSAEISEMKKGRRNISACVYQAMLIDTLMTELERAGWSSCATDMSHKQYLDLIKALSPPARVEK